MQGQERATQPAPRRAHAGAPHAMSESAAASPRRDEQLLEQCGVSVSMAAMVADVAMEALPNALPPAEEVEPGLPLSSSALPARGASIAFRGVSVAIPLARTRAQVAAGAPAERQILKDINGFIPGGAMFALMGGSGAGKTTLLDMTSQRKSEGRLGGRVMFDGRVPTQQQLKRDTAYIQQDDALLGWATVAETLAFTAEMKLPRGTSAADKAARVEEVIEQMGLTLARNTFVGSRLVRGLSGGERKRTGVACGLICKPRWCASRCLPAASCARAGPSRRMTRRAAACFARARSIFLDEPTSGVRAAPCAVAGARGS
jgi:ABC-type glutathione transport system ATPase component